MKTFLKLMIVALFIVGCKKEDDTKEVIIETVTDIDGNVYKTVKIGNQTWMAENLRVTKYNNGDEIEKTYFRAYNFKDSLKRLYGYMYKYDALTNPNGICPTGWHVPSSVEWLELINLLGGDSIAGEILIEDDFKALLGGKYYSKSYCEGDVCHGEFKNLNNNCYWWTTSSTGDSRQYILMLSAKYKNTIFQKDETDNLNYIRCIKDK